MPETTLRDMIAALSPPWLLDDEVGRPLMGAFGTVLDEHFDWAKQGVKLAFAGAGDASQLAYIGNDRNIERGPTQTDQGYAAQLTKAFDTWANAGGARTILSQLRLYFAPSNGPTIRAVSGNAVWHEINPSTGVVIRTNVGTNWDWGDNRWWRGWVIIDGTGRWTLIDWGAFTWGDGTVWGSSMSEGEARDINNIVKKWKPANVFAQVIVIFDSTLFERTDISPPNPNGNGDDLAWRASLDATFLEMQGT